MARRTFTNIVLALGLFCSIAVSTTVKAQQTTFAISPTQVNPVVGDTLKLNISVQNFTNIVSFQFAIEWDGALLSYVAMDSVNIPDQANFGTNPLGGNTLLVGWNSTGTAKSAPNGQRIFRLRLKVLAASTNYWAKFSDANTSIEVIQDPGLRSITPVFINLGIPPGISTLPVSGKVVGGSTLTLQKFCTSVTVNDFTDIVSAQWVHKWNPAVLRLDSVSRLNSALALTTANFNSTQAGTGRLAFAWSKATPVTLPANDTLYRACFTAIGANGTNSVVTLDSGQVLRRASGSDSRVALNGVNGTVTIGSVVTPATGLVFAASNEVAASTGSTVCVKIKVGGFTDIAVMQWSMHWDSTKMTLASVTSTAGIGMQGWTSPTSQGDFNNSSSGTLRFLWVSPSGNGYTLADSTVLMEICFTYIGASGTSSTFRFDGIPQKIQVKDGSLANIVPTFRSGSASVANVNAVTLSGLVQNANCPSGTGSITLTPSGGTGTYTYAWTGPNSTTYTTKDISAVSAGKYYVTVTSGSATKIDSFTITAPAAFATSTQLTQVSCKGGTNGTLTLTISGGTPPYAYSWLLPNGTTSTAKDLTGLSAGIYILTATDSKNCTTSRNDTITEPAAILSVTTQKTDVNCNGASTGAIVTTASGGTAPYTYSWLSPNGTTSTNKDLATLAVGIYKLTVTDSKSCTATRNDTINQPTALTVTTVATNLNCKNGASGTITTAPSGGTSPYTYNWILANTTTSINKDLSNLGAGTYGLTVTDGKLCTTTRTVTITEPDSVQIGTAAIVGTRCSQPTGSITVNTITGGNGGYTFAWTGPNGTAYATQNIGSAMPGSYSLTVKDSKNCTATRTFAIVDTAANIINSTPSVTNVICNGGTNGVISLTATGSSSLTYNWTGPNGFTATTLNISNLRAGNYTLVITDAGCSKTISATVNEPTPIVTAVQSVNIRCKGTPTSVGTGSIALNATGGTGTLTITWTGPNGFSATGQSINALKAGTYTASISDANSCPKSQSVTITEPADTLGITNSAVTPITCNGASTGAISVTVAGGTPQYSYAWTGTGGFTSTQKDISGRTAGQYTLTITDANGCLLSRSFTLTDPTPIVVNAGTTDASGSPNGTISLNVTGGQAPYTYLWTGQGVAPTAQNQTGLCPGTYNVTVRDNAQCPIQRAVTVGGSCSTPMRVVGSAAITNAGCPGTNAGMITINWEGGVAPFTAEWVKIGTPNSTVITFNNLPVRTSTVNSLPSGFYAIRITDAVGQTLATPPMEVRGSDTPVSVTPVVTNETCIGNDGSILLNVRDGAASYSFRWGTGETSQDRRNINAGNYRVTVTDFNGCIKEVNDIVVRRTPCPLTVTSSKVNPTCFGGTGSITITITNGEPAYTVTSASGQVSTLINNGTRSNSYTLSGLAAGTYTFTVRDTINTPQIVSFTLVAPSQVVINKTITGDQGSCTGSIILNVAGGVGNYTYQWNTGATSRDLFNLCCNDGRRYSVTVYDGNNCQAFTNNDSITCNIATLTLDSVRISNPICSSDSTNSRIEAFVRGGVVPYAYEWRNQIGTIVGGNSAILTNQPPGRYILTVLDSRRPNAQRIVSTDYVIRITSTLAILRPVITDASDNVISDGSTTITINPGVAPYTIRWQDNTTTTSLTTTATKSGLKSGPGEITVTDFQGCVAKVSAAVGSRACATIRINTIYYTPRDTFNIRCANNNDGGATILSLSPAYASPIRAYEWSSGEVSPTAFKLKPGINTVKITDANGQVCLSSIFLKAPLPLKDTIWINDKDRTLEAVTSGGVPPYKYLWSNDNFDKTAKISVSKSGSYVVNIEDALGCTLQDRAKIAPEATCLDGSIILTPNDDGLNENFRIKACDYKTVRLEIYNRWGQLVYSSSDYREQWYGNKNDGPSGEPLPEGVYMYILSANDSTGKQQFGKGTVNILRN